MQLALPCSPPSHPLAFFLPPLNVLVLGFLHMLHLEDALIKNDAHACT